VEGSRNSKRRFTNRLSGGDRWCWTYRTIPGIWQLVRRPEGRRVTFCVFQKLGDARIPDRIFAVPLCFGTL
jgi:hypothetical protein